MRYLKVFAAGSLNSLGMTCVSVPLADSLPDEPRRPWGLLPAKKFAERSKKFLYRFGHRSGALRKRGMPAMEGTRLRWNLVSRQDNVVSRPRHLASARSQQIRNGARSYAGHRYGRLECLGRIARGRFAHYLRPNRQSQGR